MRYIVFASVALGVVLLYLLSLASANTATASDYYKILLYLNIGLAGVLVILIAIQLWHLYKKIKTGVIKNPPPIPSKPLKKPIKPLIDNKYKMFT